MTDFVWPDDLVPYAMSFYLQAHTGGSESPFNRATKVYGLSAPRWICSMSFRGGYDGTTKQTAYGPRLDGLIAKLKGRQNRIEIFDFRRSAMRGRLWRSNAGNSSAALGATSMTLTGLKPGGVIHAGDYIGGDGRPHIIVDDVSVATDGTAIIEFQPPLRSAIGSNAAVFGNPTAMFRLVSDDAGLNPAAVGELVNMTLDFVEDVQE